MARGGDAQEEVILLQQELQELTTAIKEEKWYSGQLKEELDKVTSERNKLEEVPNCLFSMTHVTSLYFTDLGKGDLLFLEMLKTPLTLE